MTRQEMFDRVWQHFVVNKAPASYGLAAGSHARGCYYRGKNGERCAIGVLIPDELYDPTMEGSTPDSLDFWCHAPLLELFGHEENEPFLGILQKCHDDAAKKEGDFHGDIRVKLVSLAAVFGLSVPETAAND